METILVRLKSEGQRRIWENRKNLKGRKERIVEDLTWEKEDEMEIGGDSEGEGEERK